MSQWGSTKARRVLAALLRIGWSIKREAAGSHRILSRPGWPDTVFAFHDSEEDWSYSRRLMKTRDASNPSMELTHVKKETRQAASLAINF